MVHNEPAVKTLGLKIGIGRYDNGAGESVSVRAGERAEFGAEFNPGAELADVVLVARLHHRQLACIGVVVFRRGD